MPSRLGLPCRGLVSFNFRQPLGLPGWVDITFCNQFTGQQNTLRHSDYHCVERSAAGFRLVFTTLMILVVTRQMPSGSTVATWCPLHNEIISQVVITTLDRCAKTSSTRCYWMLCQKEILLPKFRRPWHFPRYPTIDCLSLPEEPPYRSRVHLPVPLCNSAWLG